MKTEVKKTFETEKPTQGQSISKDVKYVSQHEFERAKNKVLRDFDQQLRSLSKR